MCDRAAEGDFPTPSDRDIGDISFRVSETEYMYSLPAGLREFTQGADLFCVVSTFFLIRGRRDIGNFPLSNLLHLYLLFVRGDSHMMSAKIF